MPTTPRWGGLRPEPYNPRARDADGDGIVQEGTAFERPVGTVILGEFDQPLQNGYLTLDRDTNWQVYDLARRTVIDYTPSYGGAFEAPLPRPLERTQGTVGARTGTIREMAGTVQDNTPLVSEIVGTVIEPPKPRKVESLTANQILPIVLPEDKELRERQVHKVGSGQIPRAVQRTLEYADADEILKKLRENNPELYDQFVESLNKKVLSLIRSDVITARGKPIAIGVPRLILPDIIEDGRYKTQFETGSSGGWFGPEERAHVENVRLGIPPDIDPSRRPAYGYRELLADDNDNSINEMNPYVDQSYGEYLLILKDETRKRSAITVGDSLGEDIFPIADGVRITDDAVLAATSSHLLDDYAIRALREILLSDDGVLSTRDAMDVLDDIQNRVEMMLDHLELHRLREGVEEIYIESQIIGGVTLEDVEYISLPPNAPLALQKLLQDRGIPFRIRRAPLGPDEARVAPYSIRELVFGELGRLYGNAEPFPDDVRLPKHLVEQVELFGRGWIGRISSEQLGITGEDDPLAVYRDIATLLIEGESLPAHPERRLNFRIADRATPGSDASVMSSKAEQIVASTLQSIRSMPKGTVWRGLQLSQEEFDMIKKGAIHEEALATGTGRRGLAELFTDPAAGISESLQGKDVGVLLKINGQNLPIGLGQDVMQNTILALADERLISGRYVVVADPVWVPIDETKTSIEYDGMTIGQRSRGYWLVELEQIE